MLTPNPATMTPTPVMRRSWTYSGTITLPKGAYQVIQQPGQAPDRCC